MQHYTLLAFDTRTGERVAELWDGEGTSVEGGPFARRARRRTAKPGWPGRRTGAASRGR